MNGFYAARCHVPRRCETGRQASTQARGDGFAFATWLNAPNTIAWINAHLQSKRLGKVAAFLTDRLESLQRHAGGHRRGVIVAHAFRTSSAPGDI